MFKNNQNILVVSILLLCTILVAIVFFSREESAQAAGFQITNIGSVASSSQAVSVSGVSTRLVASTTNPTDATNAYVRIYAAICNANATPVAINLNGDKAANAATGQVTGWIAAAAGYNACFELDDQKQYLGSITASSSAGAVSVTVQQFVM